MKIMFRKKRGAYLLVGVKFKILLKKIGIVLLASALFSLLLSACTSSPAAEPTSPGAITDQAGRAVTLKGTPQRIVSLAPSNTEILFALGLGDKIMGVTDYCNYPPETKQKPSIGGFSTPNIEAVVAKTPDLVVAANIHVAKIVPQLEARGLTVIVLDPKNIGEVESAITLVGKVTGKNKEAQALTSSMEKRVKAVTDETAGLTTAQKPSVCFIVWHDPLMIAGSGTFYNELIEKSGGANIGHELTGYSKDFSLENLVMANPGVIIAGVGMGDGGDKTYQFAKSEPRLKDAAAVKNNRVYAIDQDIAGRTGPRIIDALELFAKDIYPELFK
jgi:iron complex transport system substrate-binding protein